MLRLTHNQERKYQSQLPSTFAQSEGKCSDTSGVASELENAHHNYDDIKGHIRHEKKRKDVRENSKQVNDIESSLYELAFVGADNESDDELHCPARYDDEFDPGQDWIIKEISILIYIQ